MSRVLAIFDVDGTLLRTRWSEDHGFVRCFAEVAGIRDMRTDWGAYRYSTDDGIAAEAFQHHLGRAPTRDELHRIRRRFVEILEEGQARASGFVYEIPGAAAALPRLAADGVAVAIATGGWRDPAGAKLRMIGVDLERLPAACADDALGRSQVIAIARARAAAHHGVADFNRVVYVGDARWDVRATRRLGLPFLGIGTGPRGAVLSEAGAREVLPDYTDYATFRAALDRAAPPREAPDPTPDYD